MGLQITRLSLTDFRSYTVLEIEPDSSLTLLVGPNAAGKTNIIEAIQLTTAGDSFRRPTWADLVRWGADEAAVRLEAAGDERFLEIDMAVGRSGRRAYRVNGKLRRKISEVAGIIPCVVFTPDDLRLVKDSADRRRGAVDSVGDQLSPAYLAARMEYDRIVRQRNALLKVVKPDPAVLEAMTDKLVAYGVAYMGHRHRLFDRIASKLSEVYATLSSEETLRAEYVPSWDRGQQAPSGLQPAAAMREALERVRAEEMVRGLTLVGPHRDEIMFLLDGRDAKTFSSQGQVRTIALAWKLAEVMVMTEIAGQSPVLLLDDVMSELDEKRRHALTSFVGTAAQTFITTTNLGYFEDGLVSRAKVIRIP